MKHKIYNIQLSKVNKEVYGKVQITGSKSESNRVLILDALFPNKLTISNLSNSDDTQVMQKALASKEDVIDIGHAGTSMRFLTAYFAQKENSEIILTGSERMKQRPIGVLVEALKSLGAEIEYVDNEGFPPLKIKGRKLNGGQIEMAAHVSSQFLSALLLSAAKMQKGLEIIPQGKITSWPYLKMTLDLLEKIGIQTEFSDSRILVYNQKEIDKNSIAVESDWSSASYFYSLLAIANKGEIILNNYRKNSLQGDSQLVKIYEENFQVKSEFIDDKTLKLSKLNSTKKNFIELDLIETPDIAQTILATCSALKIPCHLTGLHTLKIKETDRLVAMQTELKKFGVKSEVGEDFIKLIDFEDVDSMPAFDTYNDHRMAMALSPLAFIKPIRINDAHVVSKSYPEFWQDLETLGFKVDVKE